MVYRNGIAFESDMAHDLFSIAFKLCLKEFPERSPELEYVSEIMAKRFLCIGLCYFDLQIHEKSKKDHEIFFRKISDSFTPSERKIVKGWVG